MNLEVPSDIEAEQVPSHTVGVTGLRFSIRDERSMIPIPGGAQHVCNFCGWGVDDDALNGSRDTWICRNCAISAGEYYWAHHDCMMAGAAFDKQRVIAAVKSRLRVMLDGLESHWWKSAPWRTGKNK